MNFEGMNISDVRKMRRESKACATNALSLGRIQDATAHMQRFHDCNVELAKLEVETFQRTVDAEAESITNQFNAHRRDRMDVAEEA